MKLTYKKAILSILKMIKYFIYGVVIFLSVYLLSVYVLSRVSVNTDPNNEKDIAIFLKSNGVHTDIVVPTRTEIWDWSKQIKSPQLDSVYISYPYLAIGWGDKGFYLETPTWAELKFSTAFKAAFGLSKSAMHTTYYKFLKPNENCKKVFISKDQYKSLVRFIQASFQVDQSGEVLLIDTDVRYGKTDAFYEGNGKYNIFYTCNTWTNECLKVTDQKACLWTIFDKPILDKYK